MSTPAADGAWRNRIVGQGEAPPAVLMEKLNKMNWRLHPAHQREVLGDVLDRVGFVQRVVVNRTTDRVLDGHLRIELAYDRNQPTVPFEIIEVTEDEERLLLATFDPITGLAQADAAKLSALIEDLPDLGTGALAGMIDDLRHIEIPDYSGFRHGDGSGQQPAQPQEFWPTIRIQVPPATYARWQQLMDAAEGANDAEKFGWCLREDA